MPNLWLTQRNDTVVFRRNHQASASFSGIMLETGHVIRSRTNVVKRDDKLLERSQNSEHFFSGIDDLVLRAPHIIPSQITDPAPLAQDMKSQRHRGVPSGCAARVHVLTQGARVLL